MSAVFDRRIVSEEALEFIRECQRRESCHLGGGAALAGVWLRHRLSRDLDLFCHERSAVRALASQLLDIAKSVGLRAELKRDSGGFVRASLELGDQMLEVDLIHEALPDLEPPPPVESVLVESLTDLRASKLTCLLSRVEPRDLVDVLFLERAGFPAEKDLALAVQKDAGIDPGTLAWLLRDFPVTPLPAMLLPLTPEELREFRDDLAERLRRLSVPSG